MVVRMPPQKSDEGDQEKEPKPNRLVQSEEELGAERSAQAAATGTAGTDRGSPATGQRCGVAQ